MRVILHSISHYIGDLIETSVVKLLHRMEYTPLHRLQAVLYMRHGTLKNYIRRIIEKPILVHSRQMGILFFRNHVRRMSLLSGSLIRHIFDIFVFFYHTN